MLGLRVVAEGVESARELAVVEELGADYAQGFYFSPPLPADELVRYADSGSRRESPG